MMSTRGTLTILTICNQSILTTLDRTIRNCRDRYQVWYEDREKAITFCSINYTTVFEIDEEVVIDKRMSKVPFNMTVISDRREGVLNDISESLISSWTSYVYEHICTCDSFCRCEVCCTEFTE